MCIYGFNCGGGKTFISMINWIEKLYGIIVEATSIFFVRVEVNYDFTIIILFINFIIIYCGCC